MEQALRFFGQLKRLFLAASEMGLALIALVFVVYMLLGEDSGAFVINVVTNASLLVDAISAQAIVGVAMAIAVVGLFRKK